MRMSKSAIIAVALVSCGFADRAARAASLSGDYQTQSAGATQSASSPWVYYYGINPANRTGSYNLLPDYDTNLYNNGSQGWTIGNDGLPLVGVNRTGATIVGATFSLPNNAVYTHPANDPSNAGGAGYLVPATGLYNISGSVTDIDSGPGDGVTWFVDRNGGDADPTDGSGNLAAGSVSAEEVDNVSDTFSLTDIPLTAGDRVYIGVGANASFNSDSTAIELNIEPVPEPASLVLLGVAGLGLLRRRRRA